ncbi:gluconate 2-dehydrogenase subunit 3 family protein [Polaribacter litorisediminis]|uniref:gluconate 2-dehydrogenase subunit 3 family protein n=1 Tax=Polaribacter litorisediminis TaxID=1908341 RepID=UPI001CBF9B94|nr:gluconate 2-dehydrogenase subunit 3 family protein [Polaribacter litorisediminis]UAM96765.1 gluconate 2-dehydrogenase subunit 3 family protein [Polaribacter litorisediminis]
MNRRKAIGGILAFAGIGVASVTGFNFFYGTSNRGKLKNYLNLLSEIVDVIIPPTDTPGAKEANVHEYIVAYMESCSSNKEFNSFYNGLHNLQDTCLSNYNTSFENCTKQQKTTVLESLDVTYDATSFLAKVDTKIRGRSFFNILKSLTIEGYCTSELGATKFLAYAPVPASYKAITTLQPNQKAWATK